MLRVKLVADMVEGIRSIKSCALETSYLHKLVSVRSQQASLQFAQASISAFGGVIF